MKTISPWWLIDLSAFRAHFIREGMRRTSPRQTTQPPIKWGVTENGDASTSFAWFVISSFPESPPLLIASSVDDRQEPPLTADDIPWRLQ